MGVVISNSRPRRTLLAATILACVLPFAHGTTQTPRPETSLFDPDYALALPGYEYVFPRDHGSHPNYKLEWWYYTGHLSASDGRTFGYELTFFRIGTDRRSTNPSAWSVQDLHVAHFALSDFANDRFSFAERVNRQGPGIAHAREATLDVQNESWSARLDDGVMRLRAYSHGILLELALSPDKPPVIHGREGISQKADGVGQASHYYSMTRLATTGFLSIDGESVTVEGESWMDHEFGTNQLGPAQVGWDWFSLQLDNGEELMLYQLRNMDGSIDHNSSGTVIAEAGGSTHLTADEFSVGALRSWQSPVSSATYRLDWELDVPAFDAQLRVIPLMDNQELVTTRSTGIAYWEGAVRIEGTWRGVPVTGRGYVELTGYADEYRPSV